MSLSNCKPISWNETHSWSCFSYRHQLTKRSYCNATLVLNLQKEDDSRRWRCQVETKDDKRETHLDFTSSFLFESISSTRGLQPPAECPVRLPISRIVLCVALPLMVGIVGVVTWVSDRKRNRMLAAAQRRETMRMRLWPLLLTMSHKLSCWTSNPGSCREESGGVKIRSGWNKHLNFNGLFRFTD